MTNTILRLPAVKTESGLSRSTIYLRIKQGLFTKPIRLGERAAGWPSSSLSVLKLAKGEGPDRGAATDANQPWHLGLSFLQVGTSTA